MTLDPVQLRELEVGIADSIYIQVAKWHLYLGDAGLAQALALECSAKLDLGSNEAARQALETVQVQLGNGITSVPLSKLITSSQVHDLEEILDPFCR